MIIRNMCDEVNSYLNILYAYIYGCLCILAYILMFMDSHSYFLVSRIIDIMLCKIVS